MHDTINHELVKYNVQYVEDIINVYVLMYINVMIWRQENIKNTYD